MLGSAALPKHSPGLPQAGESSSGQGKVSESSQACRGLEGLWGSEAKVGTRMVRAGLLE